MTRSGVTGYRGRMEPDATPRTDDRRDQVRDRFRRQRDQLRSEWDDQRWAEFADKYGPATGAPPAAA